MKKTALLVILGVGSVAATAVGVPSASAEPSLIQRPSSSQNALPCPPQIRSRDKKHPHHG
jgi:hypothetical protein